MSDTQKVYTTRSLLSESLQKCKEKQCKSKPIEIPCKNKSYSRIGINEVNEIDGIKKNMKQEKSFEDITKLVASDSNYPPSNFSPNTPPEHNMIYSHMYYNDNIMMSNYNHYNVKEELIQSL